MRLRVIAKCWHPANESSNIIRLAKADAITPAICECGGIHVNALTTKDLAGACRTFMDLAYPGGPQTIPAFKLPYYEMSPEQSLIEFLPPAPKSVGVTKTLSRNAVFGYEFRLGSAAYQHLKLRVQSMDLHDREVWVYSVDTHDGIGKLSGTLSPEDAQKWRTLMEQNRALKRDIESALGAAGYLTPIALLRFDLTAPAGVS